MIEPNDHNPFRHLKARTSLWVVLIDWALAQGIRSGVMLNYIGYGLLLLWMGWQFDRLGISVRRLVGTQPRAATWRATAIIFPVLVAFSASCWVLSTTVLSLVSPSAAQTVIGQADSTGRAMTWTLAVLVSPPIEELFFRGVLLHRWGTVWGLRRAVLFSSLAFAVPHPNPLGGFVFGCVLGVLYLRGGALIVSILCHSLYNLIAATLVDVQLWQGWPVTTTALVSAGLTLVTGSAVLCFIWKNWPDPDCRAPYFVNADSGDSELLDRHARSES